VPYKDPEIRRIQARKYTADYRARQVKPVSHKKCLYCGSDMQNMRSNAIFCSREHKRKHADAQRDYKTEYAANIEARRANARKNYHNNIDKNREKQLDKQKNNPSLYAAHTAKRRAAILCRTPKWLTEHDLAGIKKFYVLADELSKAYGFKWHVDHIIPLQGKYVSGLHVANNLQVIPASVNIAKHNRFEVA
jgi:hypothetical protein